MASPLVTLLGRNHQVPAARCAALGLALLVLAGCAGMGGRTGTVPINPRAQEMLSRLAHTNAKLGSFKASGRIAIRQKGELKINQRSLWAGQGLDKLRLTILGIDGRPFTSMVRDGQWLYLLLHPEGRLERLQLNAGGLHRLARMELSADDLTQLLLGQIPLADHKHVAMSPAPSPDSGWVLVLRGRWQKVLQRIYFKREPLQVYRIERLDSFGTLRYRADLAVSRDFGPFRIPCRIDISDGQQDGLTIELQRYWPNSTLPAGIFTLKPPAAADGQQG